MHITRIQYEALVVAGAVNGYARPVVMRRLRDRGWIGRVPCDMCPGCRPSPYQWFPGRCAATPSTEALGRIWRRTKAGEDVRRWVGERRGAGWWDRMPLA